MALPLEHIGRYHVLGRIAQGGMGEVYKVKTVGIAGFEKVQALKRIRPRVANDPRFIRNFVDEAHIAGKLSHRNIVQVFDFGSDDGELYLAMEFIDGVDLRTASKEAQQRNVSLPVPLACYILGEVAAGLDYAHYKTDLQGQPLDIVHCDVSPQNVMLSREGYVKILDFGVARARISAPQTSRRLRGKPRYMAPEQTRGELPTPAADVFSLGIVAWEIITGLPLFEGNSVSDILQAVRHANVPAVDKFNPDVPAAVAKTIARALSRKPKDRGTAADMHKVFLQAAQEAATGTRTLAQWLNTVSPPKPWPTSIDEEEGVTATTDLTGVILSDLDASAIPQAIPVDEPAEVPPTSSRPVTVPPELVSDSPTSRHRVEIIDQDAPMPQLFETRRAVTVAALVAGGDNAARTELLNLIGHLAYKHGAVVYSESHNAVVAVFGLEIAGEDDVADAMTYALDVVDAVEGTSSAVHKQSLIVRIAAQAGVIANQHQDSYRLDGDAVREICALAHSATPGRPLLSGAGGRLTSTYYAFREAPAQLHADRQVPVMELVGPRNYRDRSRVLHRRHGRFVGRRRELDTLLASLHTAVRENHRIFTAVTGASGVGKSRLLAEFLALARAEFRPRPRVLWVAATPISQLAPFSLIIELLQASLDLPPDRGEATRSRFMRRLRKDMVRNNIEPQYIAEIVDLIEAAMDLRDGTMRLPPEASLGDLRERLSHAIVAYRRSRSPMVDPLVVVVEDLHFADRGSMAILRQTINTDHSDAELVVFTLRQDDGPELPVAADAVQAVVELGELEGDELHTLIQERLGPAASAATIAAVAQRAGGNPLFIERVAEAIRDTGGSEIPSTVRAVILAQLDRLPAGPKSVLQHAAVAGMTFRARIIEELVDTDIHDELDLLCSKGFLRRTEAGEDNLAFARGLIHEVVYDALSPEAKRVTHAQLGNLLASRYRAGRNELPAAIAEHLERGGELAAAAAFWLRAGRLALAAFDAKTAVTQFSRTLAIDDQLGNTGSSTAATARRQEALAGREQAHGLLGNHEAQGKDLAALEVLAENHPKLLGDVQNRTAVLLLRLGDLQGALAAALDARRLALESGNERSVGEALRLCGEVYERMSDFERSLEMHRGAQETFRRIGATAAETQVLIGIGRSLITRARYEEAHEVYDEVVERIKDTPDPWLERQVCNHMAGIHMFLGHFEKAMASVQRSLAICRRYGDRAREGDNLSICGTILLQVGLYEDAREYFARALPILEMTGSRWSRADTLVYAGATEGHMGHHEGGMAYLDEALAIARSIGARYVEANALVARATALLQRDREGDLAEASKTAVEATEVARAAALPGPEIQGLSRQAEATWHLGDLVTALALSTRAIEILDEHKYLEGSEEEILYTHYQLLQAVGDAGAEAILVRAKASMLRKLGFLHNESWRKSFLKNVQVNILLAKADTIPPAR